MAFLTSTMIPSIISQAVNFLTRPSIAHSPPTNLPIPKDNKHCSSIPFGIPLHVTASFEDIPPFFESNIGPPSNPPILLARTEIPKIQVSDKRLGRGNLVTGSVRHERSNIRFNPYGPSKSNKGNKNDIVESDSDFASDLSSDSESEDDNLISKPEGEVSRPGRGGYNLEKTLGWSTKEYRRCKEHVKKLCIEHLALNKSFSFQSLASIDIVQSRASDKFPTLRRYADCWPVADFIRMELKYTSQRSRLQKQKRGYDCPSL